MKIIAIVLILGGIGGFIEGNFPVGLLFIVIGIFLLKKSNKKKMKSKEECNMSPTQVEMTSQNTKPTKTTYTFRVAGVTKEGRQNTIKGIVKDWKACNPDDVYEGLTNKEIKEEYSTIYEVDIYDWCDIELIPEPENKYDPNAIKVVSDFGMLGYVPANKTLKVKEILGQNYSLSWRLVGGKCKFYDDCENRIITETLTYGIEIELAY